METVLYLVLGFVLLWRGGDLLVQGCDLFARGHGLPPTLAGVFILGFGTSLPELAVSALASIEGNAGIAVGNVVGSNIANVALILGVSVWMSRVTVARFLQVLELPVCILATVLGCVLMQDGLVDGGDATLLLVCFAAYTAFAVATVRHRPQDADERPRKRPWFDLGMAALALCAVVGGAELFRLGAVQAAEAFGVGDTVIGLTLVALGTSLPEFATAVAAARRHKADLIVGNIIGSNIFNLLMVLGVAGSLRIQTLEARITQLDMPIALGLVVLVLAVSLVRSRRIERPVGALLVAGYFVYVAFLSRV